MKYIFSLFLSIIGLSLGYAQSYVPEEDGSKMKVQPSVEIKAYPFNLEDVEILDSPFKDAMEADVAYLKIIEPDRLLSQFRSHSGLKPKGEIYGGWESAGLAGHSLGHYLSACAMYYSVSKDPFFLDRVNYIVDELAECQEARGTGYVGAIPEEDRVFKEVSEGNIRSRGFDLNGAWAPWYTIHKIMAGLLDAYIYCDNAKALEVDAGIADWAGTILKDLSYDQVQNMLRCEYGGMNEALVNTYALTGKKKYLELSKRFQDNFVMDSLALKVDILPGKHSNTQVPKIIGAVRRYELTGDPSDYTMGSFYWQVMVNHHTYAPGGNSNYEYLGPEDELNDKLTDNTMETCNTHNMLKLTRHLFALKPEANYMEYYERALYNHILASQNRKNGMMCYFVPLRMGTQKEFSDEFHSFTCCVGTGMENHVKYGESIYYKGEDGSLYVNLFLPSHLNWKEKGVEVTMKSGSLHDQNVSLTINAQKAAKFPLYIRKPQWLASAATILINGKPLKNVEVADNGYFMINRKWKDGDVVSLEMPMDLHEMAMPDNAGRQAFFYGPVLLAGDMGKAEPDPLKGVPVFVTDISDPNKWMKKVSDDPLTFKTVNAGNPEEVSFKPFYSFSDHFYSVYWDVFTPQTWAKQQKMYEEEKRARAALEERTVDVIRLGEMQPERDHNLVGDNTEVGEDHTKKWRIARQEGYFSFDMKSLPDTELQLICTYWGMDNRYRTFDIMVEGEVVGTEDLNKFKDSKFYEIYYDIPAALTEGKDQIEVKFLPHENNEAGPVYGVRLVKAPKL